MRSLVYFIFAAVLLMLAGFCVFGFLASFEPTDNALVFRIGYAIIGIGCLVGAAVLVRSASRRNT